MRAVIFALAMLPMGAFAQVHIPDSPFCIERADATTQANQYLKSNPTSEMEIITGDAAAGWAKAYNDGAPASDWKIDEIWLIKNQWPLDDTVAFFFQGRTCANYPIPAFIFEHFREQGAKGKT